MFDSERNARDIEAMEKERQKMLRRHLVENPELSAFDTLDESMEIEKLRNLLKFIAETTISGMSKSSLEEKDKALRTIKETIESEFMSDALKST